MVRALQRSILVVLGLAFVLASILAGCAESSLGDRIPGELGGLPAGTPTRPTTPYQNYPAVHDMPPPRSTTPMSEEDQVKLEKELQAARDKQPGRPTKKAKEAAKETKKPGAKPGEKPEAKKENKKPGDGSGGQPAGAKTNP